jgi:hypothetical protein
MQDTPADSRRRICPGPLRIVCLWLTLQAVAGGQAVVAQPADDDRRVWEYTGSYGPSWFVHEGNRKWVLYCDG